MIPVALRYRFLPLTPCRWSSKYGEFPAGDPEIHHVVGTLYAEGRTSQCPLKVVVI